MTTRTKQSLMQYVVENNPSAKKTPMQYAYHNVREYLHLLRFSQQR